MKANKKLINSKRWAKIQFQMQKDQKIIDQLIADVEQTAIIFHRIVSNVEMLKSAVGNRDVLEELQKRLISQLL